MGEVLIIEIRVSVITTGFPLAIVHEGLLTKDEKAIQPTGLNCNSLVNRNMNIRNRGGSMRATILP